MKIKIDQIIQSIQLNQKDFGIGLLSGQSGLALFFQYRSLLQNQDTDFVSNIECALEKINRGQYVATYCTGIAGFAWLLAFLNHRKVLSDSDIELLNDLDDYLHHIMMSDLKNKDFDYLHGAIGYGMYFLKRIHKKECVGYLKELVETLDVISIKESDGSLKWGSIKYGTDDEIIFNLSLSHGIASIINILVRIYKAGIEIEKCELLICGAIKFLLKQEIDRNIYKSYFPSWAIESEVQLSGSRMAWCYGDLGIAITLWQAGNALNNKNWTDKSIEIMKFSATRRDLQANFVADAGLCHGAAGIGHIFYRMWWNTRLPEFKEAADYWFNETLKMAVHPDGLAGYKAWHGEEHGGWINEVGLLEGVAGIGLALMTYHYEMEPAWDECLLLS